jgi:hypothetical protein
MNAGIRMKIERVTGRELQMSTIACLFSNNYQIFYFVNGKFKEHENAQYIRPLKTFDPMIERTSLICPTDIPTRLILSHDCRGDFTYNMIFKKTNTDYKCFDVASNKNSKCYILLKKKGNDYN